MSCILCRVDKYTEIGKKGKFTIVRCTHCGMVSAIPRPDKNELSEMYRNLTTSPKKLTSAKSFIRRLKYRYMVSKIKGYFPAGKQIRLLEIGCSQGHLLDAVKRDKQIVATGIDLDPVNLDIARRKGHNVFEGTLESVKFPEGSFDAIIAIHVIEHLYDPVDTVTEINRIVSPGGIFLSIVPCVSHIKARLAGIKWKYYSPPAHLWYFSPKTFSSLLQRTGFLPIYSTCFYNRAHLRSVGKKIASANSS